MVKSVADRVKAEAAPNSRARKIQRNRQNGPIPRPHHTTDAGWIKDLRPKFP